MAGTHVINAALTRRRALRRRREESLDALLEREATGASRTRRTSFASATPSQQRTLLRGDIASMLRVAVDGLPSDDRTVVTMRYYGEHRVAEIATRLRITPNAVTLRLLRAHRVLRRRLMERGCLIATG